MAPYAEITLGYLTRNQTFPLISDGNSPPSVKPTFDAWSALAGGGIAVLLGNGFKVRPIVLAGVSHVGAFARKRAHRLWPSWALPRIPVGKAASERAGCWSLPSASGCSTRVQVAACPWLRTARKRCTMQ